MNKDIQTASDIIIEKNNAKLESTVVVQMEQKSDVSQSTGEEKTENKIDKCRDSDVKTTLVRNTVQENTSKESKNIIRSIKDFFKF